MNDQDYINLAKESGATLFEDGEDVLYSVNFNPEKLIAFAKEVEARVLEEYQRSINSMTLIPKALTEMIAERRGNNEQN